MQVAAGKETWKPMVAGLLGIVSGPFSWLVAFIVLMAGFPVFAYDDPTAQFQVATIVPALFVCGILAILGAVYAMQREKWGLALAGSIFTLCPTIVLGIAAITLIALSKNEFGERTGEEVEKLNKESTTRRHDQIEGTPFGLTENTAVDYIPGKCAYCGSSNVSETLKRAIKGGTLDGFLWDMYCFDCGQKWVALEKPVL